MECANDQTHARQTFDVLDIILDNEIALAVQDGNYDLKRVIEAIREQGGIVSNKMDAYMNEDEYLEKTKNRLDKFSDGYAIPILEKIRKSGVSSNDASKYILALYVIHDKMNSKLKEVNQRRPDNEALSGMTDEDTRSILKKCSNSDLIVQNRF